MKNPIVVSQDDFNALRKNVYAFRQGAENINKFLTNTYYKDYISQEVIRSMDYSTVKCADSEEMKQFISNTMITEQNTQSLEMQTTESLSGSQAEVLAETALEKKQMYQNALRNDKKLLDKLKPTEWQNWFQESPQRHYRRLYATAFENGSLESLKDLAEDALLSNTDFNYVVKT